MQDQAMKRKVSKATLSTIVYRQGQGPDLVRAHDSERQTLLAGNQECLVAALKLLVKRLLL